MQSFATSKKVTARNSHSIATAGMSWQTQPPVVRQVLRGPALQPKLTIGAPDDAYEREADSIADRVLRLSDADVQATPAPPALQRLCSECEEELRAKPQGEGPNPAAIVPPIVHDVLRSPGQPLAAATRAFFEPRFGWDLGDVRVHTDAQAAESALAVDSLAYTVGRDVVFGNDRYAPGNPAGNQLLAHELTHVMQQQGRTDKALQNRPRADTGAIGSSRKVERVAEEGIDSGFKTFEIASSVPTRVQRACGPLAIDEPTGCVTTTGEVSGLRYLFRVNCDEFAVGNEEDLRIDAQQIQDGETVEVHGLASIDGDPVFNMHLSCARALRAKAVIEAVLAARGVSATILVFNHGAIPGDTTQQRSVVVSRTPPAQPEQTCGPDATDWFVDQVNAAKSDPTVLAIQSRLAGASRIARRFGFSAEDIAEGAVARTVLAEEARAGSPARTAEARSQLAASARGQRAFGRALLAATVPIAGGPEAIVLAAIRGAALAWKGLVRTGGRYDFKNDSRTMQNPTSDHCPVDCARTITMCPSTSSDCFVVDVPGNLFYAHIGRFVGWTELSLQLGSQFAQLDSSATWDPPEDTRMISLGFALPDPMTRSDLCSAINSNRSIFTLQNCADCSEATTADIV